jgi:hypothetical protein
VSAGKDTLRSGGDMSSPALLYWAQRGRKGRDHG